MSTAPGRKGPLVTGEELFEMGDIGPCELIDGKIVPMSPTRLRHGQIQVLLGGMLMNFVRPRKLGVVFGGEVGIYIRRDPDRIRAADIGFVSAKRFSDEAAERYLRVAPELVAEIISPTDRWVDMLSKIADYFSIGVQRVWIVEPKTSTVLVYRSETEMTKLTREDTLRGEGILEGFALPLSELFEEPPGAVRG